MKINLKLNKNETELFSHFKKDIEMNIEKLNNFSTYLNLAKKYNSNDIIIINNHKNILQGINYSSDDDYLYWIILTHDIEFLDVMIPIIYDTNDETIYSNLSDNEIDIFKNIKSYLS
jgi:hypothetical protein